ncbi:hypothetical protein DY000_02037876 [Brassica cretica]|uniref:DUF4283 domain-containing protein n=1 Tax=Brassica cretica TaxID=69181 RepID=A0ABQ7BP71_BRACR|nr:hypothetical protein DY000_02037876 [Brassica cretica]
MFRPKKKKELSLMEELKELELLEEREMVDIPDLENDNLIEENSLSVIVRCLNPTVHKVGGLVKAIPPIWGLEDRVHGRGVGADRVQFIFQSDRDLHHVLTRGPWNDFLFQGKDYPAPDTVNKAIEDTAEWMRRQEEDKTEVKKSTSSTQHLKWTPPTQNWIKCNTDGAWHKDHQQQGIGWISRDYGTTVVGRSTKVRRFELTCGN